VGRLFKYSFCSTGTEAYTGSDVSGKILALAMQNCLPATNHRVDSGHTGQSNKRCQSDTTERLVQKVYLELLALYEWGPDRHSASWKNKYHTAAALFSICPLTDLPGDPALQ
jgi:hypothetical protein